MMTEYTKNGENQLPFKSFDVSGASSQALIVVQALHKHLGDTARSLLQYVSVSWTSEGGVEFKLCNGGSRSGIEIFSDGAMSFVSYTRQALAEYWPCEPGDYEQAARRMFTAGGLR